MTIDTERGRSSKTRGVLRVLRDLAVIIGGVLIALTAESWWEDRQDRARELEYLLALRVDLREAEVALRETISADSLTASQGRDAIVALRRAARESSPEPVGFPISFRDFSLPTGTLAALVGTGDIRLIRSSDLRAALISLDGLLRVTMATTESIVQEIYSNGTELTRAMETARHDRGATGPVGSPEIIAGLMNHAVLLRNRINRHRELLGSVERTRASVETELNGRGE